ncbi:MAG: hypothetical protein H6839_02575 [Planctomycetes bacterium]|nr:hypothetical protein [Planctomycetota bacterium]
MRRLIYPLACIALTIGACASDHCPHADQDGGTTLGPCGLTFRSQDYETTGERAAAGLTPDERDSMGAGLADDPLLRKSVEPADPFTNAAVVDDLLRGLGAPRVEGHTMQDWRAWDTGQRLDGLKDLTRAGNPWASQLLDAIESGEKPAGELDGEALRYEMNFRIQAAKENGTYGLRLASLPSGPSVEPMPFGDSMFGPWDTGSAERSP